MDVINYAAEKHAVHVTYMWSCTFQLVEVECYIFKCIKSQHKYVTVIYNKLICNLAEENMAA